MHYKTGEKIRLGMQCQNNVIKDGADGINSCTYTMHGICKIKVDPGTRELKQRLIADDVGTNE